MKLLKLDNDYPMTGGQTGLSTTKPEKSKALKSPLQRSGDLKYHRFNNIEVSKTGI